MICWWCWLCSLGFSILFVGRCTCPLAICINYSGFTLIDVEPFMFGNQVRKRCWPLRVVHNWVSLNKIIVAINWTWCVDPQRPAINNSFDARYSTAGSPIIKVSYTTLIHCTIAIAIALTINIFKFPKKTLLTSPFLFVTSLKLESDRLFVS